MSLSNVQKALRKSFQVNFDVIVQVLYFFLSSFTPNYIIICTHIYIDYRYIRSGGTLMTFHGFDTQISGPLNTLNECTILFWR